MSLHFYPNERAADSGERTRLACRLRRLAANPLALCIRNPNYHP